MHKSAHILTLSLALGAPFALAVVDPPPPVPPAPPSQAEASATAAQQQGQLQGQQQAQGQQQGQAVDVQTGDVGVAQEVNAEGGAAEAATGPVTQSYRGVRNAPSVGLVVPSPTALDQRCLGLGGSWINGSGILGWCWLAKDPYALRRFELLANLGLSNAAGVAYCGRPLHAQDFASVADCEAAIREAVDAMHAGDSIPVSTREPERASGQCDERLHRCQAVVDEFGGRRVK